MQILLSAGANPFVANAAGRTAMDEAVLSGHAGVVSGRRWRQAGGQQLATATVVL